VADSVPSCHRTRWVVSDFRRSCGSFQCWTRSRQPDLGGVQRPMGSGSHAAVVPGPLCSWCGDVRTGRRFSPYNYCCTAGDGARHLKSWCVSWLCSRQFSGVRENTETCSAHSPPGTSLRSAALRFMYQSLLQHLTHSLPRFAAH
jgi:hypothetical protein